MDGEWKTLVIYSAALEKRWPAWWSVEWMAAAAVRRPEWEARTLFTLWFGK